MRGHNLLRRPRPLAGISSSSSTIQPLPRQPFPRTSNSASQPAANPARSKSSVPVPTSYFELFLERYNAALHKRPLLVKASAASIIFFASDSATQQITEPHKNWDMARAGSGAAFGVVATAWLHYWWGFLEVAVGKRLPASTHRLSNTLTKVVVDQAMGAPMYVYTYFVITNFLQDWNATADKTSGNAEQLLDKTCNKASAMLLPTMLRHWSLWPAVHSFNFYYMPLHHRVLVQNLVLAGWSGYLSHLNNGGLVTPDGEIEVTQEVLLARRTKLRETTTTATLQHHRSTESGNNTSMQS